MAISAGVDFMGRWMNKMFMYQEKERLQAGETLWIADHPDGPYAGSKKIVDDSKEYELLTRQGFLDNQKKFLNCKLQDLWMFSVPFTLCTPWRTISRLINGCCD